MIYINIKENGAVETVDEFETSKEAKQAIKEYKMINYNYYTSKRCTKDWRNSKNV